jgi:outer membrane protein OmpU
MGDTDGALDWALTEVNFSSGSINDDETEHAGFNGSSQDIDGRFDGQVLRYDYSFGDFGIAISAELNDSSPFEEGETLDVIDDDGDVIGEVTVTDDVDGDDGDGDTYGIGIRYGLDLGGNTVNLGLGYQDIDGDDAIGVSVAGTIAGFAVGVSYIDYDDVDFERAGFDLTGVESHYGIGIGYDAGPISLSANYGEYDSDDDASGFGLSAGYDLGGGAIVQLGYGDSNFDGDDADDFETVSFGIRMNF